MIGTLLSPSVTFSLADIDIIYEDEELIAINKPHGLLVHKTKMAADVKVFALQLLRDKIGQRVYPVHRIDRKTSGVLLFTKSKDSLPLVQSLFQDRKVSKTYLAIVRGHLHGQETIDYPLDNGSGRKEAKTSYQVLRNFEIDLPSVKFNTSRYSLIEAAPHEGRHHQIRKHLSHIFHPILGDRPHGCNKQNKLWKERYGMTTMMLHANLLSFEFGGMLINITAPLSIQFQRVLKILNYKVK